MKNIIRKNSLLTGKTNLEHLITFKKFPVFMGCTLSDIKKDLKSDMIFEICKDTGIIQLKKLLPLNIVYQKNHNDGIGIIWQEHYKRFAQFVSNYKPRRVLEIGGANSNIANNCLNINPNLFWTIIEPHPLFQEKRNIKIIKGWFDNDFKPSVAYDAIIHSHVLEHVYSPEEFLKHVSSLQKAGQKMIFSVPNMFCQLEDKFTNCLNFEHTCFLTEEIIDYLLNKHRYRILEKQYFNRHSIFYTTEKCDDIIKINLPAKYQVYKALFNDFISYHLDLIKKINKKIKNFDGDLYLFGAHIFSQYLIAFGLKTDKIKGILDNSPIKQKQRLYGTKLTIMNPKIIAESNKPGVILKVGIYRDEIYKQLKKLNPTVKIFE
jgi:hypothetical protein